MPGKYDYELTEAQREKLDQIIQDKNAPKEKVARAKAMLLMDKGVEKEKQHTVKEVSETTGLSVSTLGNLRKKFVADGLDSIFTDRDEKPATKPTEKSTNEKQPEPAEEETLIASQKGADGTNEWELKLTPKGIVLSFPGDERKPRSRKTRRR